MKNNERNEILKIQPLKIPPGKFDAKGRFISLRNLNRKFIRTMIQISGVNKELLTKEIEE